MSGVDATPIIKQLLLKNGKVYVATRNRTKSEVAIEKLQDETGKLAYFLPLDLADLESVKASADEFMRHVLLLISKTIHSSDACDYEARRQSCTFLSTMRQSIQLA
jgi:hypothetical protein